MYQSWYIYFNNLSKQGDSRMIEKVIPAIRMWTDQHALYFEYTDILYYMQVKGDF